MVAFFSFTQIVISIVVILLILLHSGKDAGLSGAFGVGTGAGPFGGGSLVERNLDRWTIFFSLLFVANVILLLKIEERNVQSSRPSAREAHRARTQRRADHAGREAAAVELALAD